jgi:hypothetical protein
VAGGQFQGAHGAYNGADLYWFDTFTFAPGTYGVNLVFDGTLTENVPTGSSFDIVDNFNFLENGIVRPRLQYSGMVSTLSPGTQSLLLLTFFSPTTIQLGGLLQIRNDIGTSDFSTAGGSVAMDNSDTAYFTVTPDSVGAKFSTASGETYSPLSATPEPSSMRWLVASMGVAVWLARRRRSAHR